MDRVQEAIRAMIGWERGEPHRIQHFLKVHSFCRYIGQEEGLAGEELEHLELAGVVHDIGIRPAEEKFGKHDGPIQEREGVEPARQLLRGIGVEEAAAERIAFLVGHHHTLTGVDGIDWQILLEADFLVNSQEKAMSLSAIRRAEETFFRTESGRKLLHAQYPGLDEAE